MHIRSANRNDTQAIEEMQNGMSLPHEKCKKHINNFILAVVSGKSI